MRPILLLAFGVLLTLTAHSQNNAFIEVTGTADSLVLPNQIYLRFGLTDKDTRTKSMLEEIELKIISGLRTFGIDPDIQLSVQDQLTNIRQYALKKNESTPREYLLKLYDSKSLVSTLNLLDNLGIQNVRMDRLEHYEAPIVRSILGMKALEHARQKAAKLAAISGQQIGSIISIIEEPSKADVLLAKDAQIMMRVKRADSATEPSLDLQRILISSSLRVKFNLQ
jgi:uncharacterized protein YggE